MSTYKSDPFIRWWNRKDNAEVLEIEQLTSNHPLDERDFLIYLQERDTVGQVAILDNRVVGYIVYEMYHRSIHVVCLAVHPDYRNKDIAKRLLHKVSQKVSPAKRKCITFRVRERNLIAQQFLRHMRFICISVHRNWYYNPTEDSFFFLLSYDNIKKWKEYPELEAERAKNEAEILESVQF